MQLANQAMAIDEASINSGGQGAAYLSTLLVRRSVVELETGSPNEAASDAGKAVDLLQTRMQPGVLSTGLGRAYLALGHALRAQGKSDAAHAASLAAAENLQDSLGADHPATREAQRLAEATGTHR